MLQINKAQSEKVSSEQDTIDAFVALGGNVSSHLKLHLEGGHNTSLLAASYRTVDCLPVLGRHLMT